VHCVFYRFEHRFQKLQSKAPDSTPKHFIKKDIIPNSKGDDGIVYSKKQKKRYENNFILLFSTIFCFFFEANSQVTGVYRIGDDQFSSKSRLPKRCCIELPCRRN
jgi:hypothetical protein